MFVCVYVYRSWLSVAHNVTSGSKLSSGCLIELFANRPVHHCHTNPEKLKALIVPLIESDVQGIVL